MLAQIFRTGLSGVCTAQQPFTRHLLSDREQGLFSDPDCRVLDKSTTPPGAPWKVTFPGGKFWGLSLTHRPLERMFQNVRMEGQTYVKISK